MKTLLFKTEVPVRNTDTIPDEMPASVSIDFCMINPKTAEMEKCEPTEALFNAGRLWTRTIRKSADGKEETNFSLVTACCFGDNPLVIQ
jgi:hypothetical protein